jgi:hypothetical protein
MTELPPRGIPNSIGNTCWFQACTQCLFRDPEIRSSVLSFSTDSLRILHDPEVISAFRALFEHFSDLNSQNRTVSNARLVQLLRDRQRRPLVSETTTTGRDSYYALEAYFDLFAILLGDRTPGFHSLNPPFGCLQSLRLSDPRKINCQIYLTIEDAVDIQTAVLARIEGLLFLPRVLVLRHDRASAGLTYPDPVLELPEPFDWVAAGKDMAGVKAKVEFELFGMVCYTGQNCDHAVALVKGRSTGKWYYCNDQSVEEKGDDRCLKDTRMLSPGFVWPSLFFYRKRCTE